MVSPISSIRFGAATAAPAANILERPGAFAKPAGEATQNTLAQDAAPKKKHSAGKIALGVLGAAVAVAAALAVGARKDFLKILSETTEPTKAGANWLEKTGHYLGTAGEWIAKHTCDPIVNWFKKSA